MITDLSQVNSVDIIVISSDLEAQAIRAILESFHIQTRVHYIGNITHFTTLFQNPDYLHKAVIICCHGGEEGLVIPELSPELEKDMPFSKILTPSNLSDIISLNNQLVINTGCCMGRETFAKSFIAKGAKFYIGANDYIESEALVIFITNFIYYFFAKSMPAQEAFDKASSIDAETSIVRIWENFSIKDNLLD